MKPNNFTRYSDNLDAKFRAAHRFDLVALYHFLQLSDFAREGIAHSGSYLFADHMYRNEPSGRGWIGRALDRVLLRLPATVAMRSRCDKASKHMEQVFRAHIARHDTPFRILTIPCGLPRDFRDFARRLTPEERTRVSYSGADIDPRVVRDAKAFLDGCGVDCRFFESNALAADGFGEGEFDFISSTGLGEFLDDSDLAHFYANVRQALSSGGTFFTSAAAHEQRSEWLLRTFEFDTRYRGKSLLRQVLKTAGFRKFTFSQHPNGLQTYVQAVNS